MVIFADTGFIASVYLKESTSTRARAAMRSVSAALPLTPLAALELRNAFNRCVQMQRITLAQRDALWQDVETDISSGFLYLTVLDSSRLHEKARQLSDRYTPATGTRTLDLLHVAAAILLEAKTFFSFDERQRKAAAGEGLNVKP